MPCRVTGQAAGGSGLFANFGGFLKSGGRTSVILRDCAKPEARTCELGVRSFGREVSVESARPDSAGRVRRSSICDAQVELSGSREESPMEGVEDWMTRLGGRGSNEPGLDEERREEGGAKDSSGGSPTKMSENQLRQAPCISGSDSASSSIP